MKSGGSVSTPSTQADHCIVCGSVASGSETKAAHKQYLRVNLSRISSAGVFGSDGDDGATDHTGLKLDDHTEYCTLNELKQSNLRTLEIARQVSSEAAQVKYHLEALLQINDKSAKQQEFLNSKADILLLKREKLINKVKSMSKLRDEMILQAMSKSAELSSLRDKRDTLLEVKRDFEISKELKKCASECMKHELGSASKTLGYMRDSNAVKILKSFKIVTNLSHPSRRSSTSVIAAANTPKRQSIHLHGCSTIMGLPLPNNGFYDHVPLEILCSIINIIAKVVKLIANSLHIPLPHPLDVSKSNLTAAELVLYPHDDRMSPIHMLPADLKVSVSTIDKNSKLNTEYIWHSISDISNRESSPWRLNPSFPRSMRLLQANIIILCIRIGLDPTRLWPPEGILLNINEILLFLENKTAEYKSSLDVELPKSDDIILLESTTTQLFGFDLFTDPRPSSNPGSKHNSNEALSILAPGSPQRAYNKGARGIGGFGSPGGGNENRIFENGGDVWARDGPGDVVVTPSNCSPDGTRRLRTSSGDDAWSIIEDI